MRYIFFLIITIPTISMAAGADSQEYIGVTNSGKLVRINFLSDGNEWTGHNFIYGASKSTKFRYCWINEEPIDSANPKFSPRRHTHFVCASTRNKNPEILYKAGSSYDNKAAPFYKEAMADFEKVKKAGYERNENSMNSYYICEKGCSNETPPYLFDVGFYD